MLKRRAAIAIIIALMVICYIFPISAKAQEITMRTLTVTGNGKEKIPTTLMQVQIGVEIRGQTSSQVQQEVANKSSSVVDLLRSRDVQQLRTTGISLRPYYNRDSSDRQLIGYVGSNIVSFRFDNAKVGSLLDDAVNAGATRIDSLSFTATDNAISTARQKALQAAVRDARSQAETVLSSLNFSTQDIISIQVNGANIPQPIQRSRRSSRRTALADESFNVDTPVIGGEQTVAASVTLQIKY